MDTACGCMRQGMRDTTADTDDVKARVAGFQLFVDLHFHVAELDLHAVQQRIVVCRAGCNFVQGVDHLNDAIQDSLGQHQVQIGGGGIQSRNNEGIVHAAGCRAAAADQIAKPPDYNTAAQHIHSYGNTNYVKSK